MHTTKAVRENDDVVFIALARYASYLINDDASSLDKDDPVFSYFEKLHKSNYIITITSDEPFYANCVISGIAGNCVEYIALNIEKRELNRRDRTLSHRNGNK